jgi:CRISPR/Cas system-associated exonuclease Cas4 (RecB family)
MRKRLTSWSYSVWNIWSICPKRTFFSKIMRVPEKMSRALLRGNDVHKAGEQYLKGEIAELPKRGTGKEFIPFLENLEELKRHPTLQVESDFSFTKSWRTTRWNDWDNCWVRMKLDAKYMPERTDLVVVDFKTGQVRDYEKQVELYALGGFKRHPAIEVVTGEIWYLDHPELEEAIIGYEFDRSEVGEIQERWEERVRPMMEDATFEPNPGSNCGWCPYSKEKDGPCEAG